MASWLKPCGAIRLLYLRWRITTSCLISTVSVHCNLDRKHNLQEISLKIDIIPFALLTKVKETIILKTRKETYNLRPKHCHTSSVDEKWAFDLLIPPYLPPSNRATTFQHFFCREAGKGGRGGGISKNWARASYLKKILSLCTIHSSGTRNFV